MFGKHISKSQEKQWVEWFKEIYNIAKDPDLRIQGLLTAH